jgi:anthranilate synthase component 1
VTETFSFELDHIPELLDLVAAYPQQFPFLLDSAAPGPLGRYSLLLRAGKEHLSLSADGSIDGPGDTGRFLDRLKQWQLDESFPDTQQSPWPFCGGWFVFLAYELAAEIEPKLDLPAAKGGLPVALAVRCKGAVIVEHGEVERAYIVAENETVLQQMKEELSYFPARPVQTISRINSLAPDPNEDFTLAVNKIHRYLEDGDVFQVNLSRAWSGSFDEPVNAIELYSRLRKANPAPFAGLMRWGDSTLLSSSPERLVELHDREVQTRPIAGTYPRGHDKATDLALAKDMLAHPKERAEHIMLIDLERNDLGRVCEIGSVEVSELMVLESYAHVHHIVSNVKGRLSDNVGPADVIRAVFPGGTITGCPKVRCMEIIAELEQTGRGFYTGSMGYISLDGQMDLNILIRSMLVEGDSVSLRTGAGIVADSVPERELAETVNKAKGVLRALEQTND